jgi:phytoene dehydrogenase-like protein
MSERWDAIVVGAGLAGMMAALELSSRGRRVLVVDRRTEPGGRCGHFTIDGYSFTRACNDFGARIQADLARVGVRVPFAPSTNVVDFETETLRFPPRLTGVLRLSRHLPSIARMVLRVRGGDKETIGALFGEHEREGMGFRLLSMLGYVLGTPPQCLRADLVRADFSGKLGYGHDRMVVPQGGPQAITDAMVERLRALGARLELGVDVTGIAVDGDGLVVDTARGSRCARTVLSTFAPAPRGRAGLKVCQLLFAVEPAHRFVDARTLIVSPPRADRWLAELDEGRWSATYGFHVFQDRPQGHVRTLTGYALAPRGHDRFDPARRSEILERVKARLEQHAPGFLRALRYERLLDPAEYEALHGVSSTMAHEIPEGDEEALAIEGEAPGLFRIGNAVAPPGDHANAAMLSGVWAAEHAARHLNGTLEAGDRR